MSKNNNKKRGFTLIEVLVVIAIIAILAAIVIVAINPAKRFQDARMTQRQANVESILSAIQQNMVDNKGIFDCTDIPTTATVMKSETSGYDIAPCLSPYLAILPVDPDTNVGSWKNPVKDPDTGIITYNYNTGYEIVRDNNTGQITISAPEAEKDNQPQPGYPISVTR